MRLLLVGALSAALVLSSCSGGDPPPEDTAAELAGALTTGTLPAELFSGGSPQEAYSTITGDLQEAATGAAANAGSDAGSDAAANAAADGERPTVTVGEVTEQDGRAEAALTWAWQLEGRPWSYRSTAELVDGDAGWRVRWAPSIVEPSLTDGERLEVTTTPAPRGDILGASEKRIVTDRPVVRFGIDKTKVPAARALDSARRAAALLEVSVGPYVRAVRGAGEAAFVEAIVLRPQDARDVDPGYDSIPGAVALRDELPLAPTREFAAPLLGRVGPVTAELVEESEGRLAAGDLAGLSGLQQRYDEQVTGEPGVTVSAVDAAGTSRELFAERPVAGQPLRTTLDLGLQAKAERVLATSDPDPPATALVALRPATGAVLAAASGPGADGLNLATFGQYAPGSTFKVVSSLALLRSGLTPNSPMTCPPTTTVNGKSFTNYDDYPPDRFGSITLRQAVAYSCNTAFISSRARLEDGALADAAASLGLGVDHDVGFPAYFGQVPPPASRTEAAADLIGQGRILASPLTMATVAASVRSGRTVVPHLLADLTVPADPPTPLTSSEARALQGLMRAVVTEGSGSLLRTLPGQIGAKTGTAEYGEPGPDGALRTHAWMIATRDDLAVAVFVETGDSGSATAGPLLQRFLS